ncbi:hypothetical protein DevBK_00450 [Devosia sp. BK]|uniref:PRC-barrel domain-containing protein n=1 Tax=unclassified Devosia TaxID=196773 RepID=UPI000713B887|nr:MULTISPECIES: PRC-barrel domain-containing protein [unclassified Devosia]KQN71584.1 hypothetical protein ASE94_11120 [Devosia sp. Leaf64]KQT45692.1 hypothetical protein ASG47_12075 [Devosia sp. Leaf420]MDV3249788.1 hypothetical protein [Devosia sp. BK]
MKKANFALVPAVALLVAAPALAQAPTQWVELEDTAQVAAFNSTVDQIEDWDLYDAAGIKIGEVEAVLGTDATTATALVVDFEEAAGYVDGDVIVPIDQFTWEANRLSLAIEPTAAQQLELWND